METNILRQNSLFGPKESSEIKKKITPLLELKTVDAAGVSISLEPMPEDYVWNFIIPVIQWIQAQLLTSVNGRIFIGIVGSPGAGKTVLSNILSTSFNLIYGNVSIVLGMDAYHHTNEYLG
jgi:pantothenate kinase-related protein Tda10